MELTIDLVSTDVGIATLGSIAAESLKYADYVMFYVDSDGLVRATNTHVLNLREMEEAAAIKVLAAYGKSREEIIEFLKQMEQERTEREKTDNPVIPSEHS
jgi:hypothetical protein